VVGVELPSGDDTQARKVFAFSLVLDLVREVERSTDDEVRGE
jgi:hypothetical protein